MLNVIWCQWWNDDLDEPDGAMHDLGRCSAAEVSALVRGGHYAAVRGGWGTGQIVVTDDAGQRVDFAMRN